MPTPHIPFNALCQKLAIDPNQASEKNYHTLHTWCLQQISADAGGDYAALLRLAKDYLDIFLPEHQPNSPDQKIAAFHNMSTLQYAAYQGYQYFLTSLPGVDASACNQKSAGGMTPLHLAATRGHYHTVLTLLALGADANLVNDNLALAIHLVLQPPYLDMSNLLIRERIFQILLKHTADPTQSDRYDNNICHFMAQHGFVALLQETLASHKTLAFQANKNSHYPIHLAILNQESNIITNLLSIAGVSELCDCNQQNALHYAAQYISDQAVLDDCIVHSHDLVATDHEGLTAKKLAEQSKNRTAITALSAAEKVHTR